MKYIIKSIAALLAIVILSGALSAQALQSSYFMDKMTGRHQLNPAFKTGTHYVGMPILSNFYLGINSNAGLGTFLYPQEDKLVTFLHESVEPDKFLRKLSKSNAIELDLGINLLSFGFWAWGGQNTFDLSLKSNMGVYLPKDLFKFLKIGQNGTGVTQYDLSNIAFSTDNYAELSLGHARDINEKWGVGANLKVLLGVAHGEMKIDRMDLSMSQDGWYIKQQGHFQATSILETKIDPETGEVTDVKIGDDFGLSGFGLGLDLGATYKPIKDLTISASFTDIGFMKWNNLTRAETNPNNEFRYTGFSNIGVKDDANGDNAFEGTVDELGDDLAAMASFYMSERSSITNSLRTTMRVGAEYGILKNHISFGLLSTTRFVGHRVYAEGMAAVNFRPFSALHITLNGSLSNMGNSLGAVVNICAPGFNFFVGADYISTKYSKQFIPVDHARANLCLGLNFTFGKKRIEETRRVKQAQQLKPIRVEQTEIETEQLPEQLPEETQGTQEPQEQEEPQIPQEEQK